MFTNKKMFLTTFAVILALVAVPSLAVDEYGIRCNPGGGQLPKDGVICLAFRPRTTAGDFATFTENGKADALKVAANGRGT